MANANDAAADKGNAEPSMVPCCSYSTAFLKRQVEGTHPVENETFQKGAMGLLIGSGVCGGRRSFDVLDAACLRWSTQCAVVGGLCLVRGSAR
jgi:hypothetical protein